MICGCQWKGRSVASKQRSAGECLTTDSAKKNQALICRVCTSVRYLHQGHLHAPNTMSLSVELGRDGPVCSPEPV